MRFALQSTLLSFMFVLLGTIAAAQETAGSGLPFNPDSDNNGAIDVTDLLNFLPYYGEDFVPTGSSPWHLVVLGHPLLLRHGTPWVCQQYKIRRSARKITRGSPLPSVCNRSLLKGMGFRHPAFTPMHPASTPMRAVRIAMPKIASPRRAQPAPVQRAREQQQVGPPAIQRACSPKRQR